jgi:penicillin-binding protein 2
MRIGLLGGLALFVFGVLLLRLWALQVLSGDGYLRTAQDNQLRTIRLEAPRGAILDRRGRVIVTNKAGTLVRIWPSDLPKRGAYDELARLSRVLGVPLSRTTRDIEKRHGDPVTPVVVKANVDDHERDYLLEHRRDFSGVDVHEAYLRQYPHGMLSAQLVGFVGEISRQQLERRAKGGFRPGDRIGQTGLEAAYDAYLRGAPGEAQLRVDSHGKARSDVRVTRAFQPGKAVRTTIDLDLQHAAERALQRWTTAARTQDCHGCWASNGGAIVALDPRDGGVLALASLPTYNPALYTGRVDPRKLHRAGLLNDATARRLNYPGLDRATQGVYPAGSTWKPVTALAAMQEHLISPYTPIDCTPDYLIEGQLFKNWTPYVPGPITLPSALEQSCDTYFYRVGMMFYRLPPERGHPLQRWAARFGFGQPTGIELRPEARGLLPTPEWRERAFRDPVDKLWKPGDSIQLAIGQKDLEVTPLQMARFYALIANGGKLVTPHLGLDVERPGKAGSRATVLRRLPPPEPKPTGVDPAALAVVRQGLYEATHGVTGTATSVFGSFPVKIAGKTGTAEKAVRLPGWRTADLVDQSWWCGYGPADDPTLVVCALIENGGHGGTAAAPAALDVFARYFGIKAQYQLPSSSD